MVISKALPVFGASLILMMPLSAALANCSIARSMMERLICADPAVAARDTAMTILYRVELLRQPSALAAQRQWLSGALRCRTRVCLIERYDARNAALLQSDGGRRVARRYHLENESRNGDLLVLERGYWITYDVTETVIGPRGEAAGDVSAARLQGTVRMTGNFARDVRPNGCAAVLQRNRDGSWSVGTRHCFDGDRADLNDLFRPAP